MIKEMIKNTIEGFIEDIETEPKEFELSIKDKKFRITVEVVD